MNLDTVKLLEERQRKEEAARIREQEARWQERQMAHEEQARAERVASEQRLAMKLGIENEAKERKQAMRSFFAKHGFTGVNDPRRSGCCIFASTMTYPLHCAAELGDARMVEILLKEGAKISQTNSAGRTAMQAAQKKSIK